jgi:hypothetical protein
VSTPIAKLVKRVPPTFSIYVDGVHVADATTVTGIDEAVAATAAAGSDRLAYVPGLYIAGLRTAAHVAWFSAWRSSAMKRYLIIRDVARARAVRVTGAFVTASSEGAWYDLAIDTAAIEDESPI